MYYYKNFEFDTQGVYEPAEDSLLLVRVIESLDLEGKKFLDMGCGSGIQGIVAASLGATVSSVDHNPDAVRAAKYNAEINGVDITVRRSNMFGSVRGKFDYIVFNSPYLPVTEAIKGSETWAGGENLEVIRKFLEESKEHLEQNGKIFLLVSSATGMDVIEQMIKENDYISEIKDKEKIDWEMLYVLEIKAK